MNLSASQKMRLIVLIGVLVVCAVALRLSATTRSVRRLATMPNGEVTLETLPETFLWAWERPERLEFIDPRKVGVAFLSKTIDLSGDRISIRPRLQPLSLPANTKLVAVVRIQTDRHNKPSFSDEQLARTVSGVVEAAHLPAVLAVQIDFDAKTSEREFYRRLLAITRKQLPDSTALSITALSSWCAGDNWLRDMPIDEAVPMLFRMGIDGRQFASTLAAGNNAFTEPCNAAAGVSTDELISPPIRQRLYIFSPTPWTPESVNAALENYAR